MIADNVRQILSPLNALLPYIWQSLIGICILYVVVRLITKLLGYLQSKLKKPINCRECTFNWLTYDEVLAHVERKDFKKHKLSDGGVNGHK